MRGFVRRLIDCKDYYCNISPEAKWLNYKSWIVEELFFAYRKQITVTEQSGNGLTDYQVLIELNSTNFDFSHANEDGSDIRFYDGSNFLNYWIEKWDSANQEAKIWVKVPSIPASSSTSFYMYYGNPDVASVSNGEDTFEFFDDFEGTSLDINKWIEDTAGVGTVMVSNGILTIDETGGGTGNMKTIHTNTYIVPTNVVVEAKVREEEVHDTSYGQTAPIVGEIDVFPFHLDTQNAQFMFSGEGNIRTIGHQSKNNGTWGTEDTIYDTTPTLNTWYRVKWIKKSTSQSWYWMDNNGNVLGSLVDNTDPPQGATTYYLTLGARGMKSSWDWILVRKYTDPEPSVSLGSEETS